MFPKSGEEKKYKRKVLPGKPRKGGRTNITSKGLVNPNLSFYVNRAVSPVDFSRPLKVPRRTGYEHNVALSSGSLWKEDVSGLSLSWTFALRTPEA